MPTRTGRQKSTLPRLLSSFTPLGGSEILAVVEPGSPAFELMPLGMTNYSPVAPNKIG